MRVIFICLALVCLSACTGGYSFTGGDVGDAKTVSVANFPNYAELFQPNLSLTFSESLRNIFVQQTRLTLVTFEGDLHFEGEILKYYVEPINAQADAQVAQNRLTITVNVRFTNRTDETKDFEKSFTRFADFPGNSNLIDVEEELIQQINTQLSEDILNAAIANW
jgi:hypothetical protein